MDALKQLLEDLKAGKITLEQYKAQAKAVLSKALTDKAIDQAEHDKQVQAVDAETGSGAGGGGSGGLTLEEVQRMIQSETDKVRGDYSKKLKDAEEALEKIKREKMTEEERAQADREKAARDLKEREDALNAREVALHTVEVLTAKGLPLQFRDFLAGSNKEETDKRVVDFETAWAKALKEAVEAKFKDGGSDPNKGKGGGGGDKNPFSKEHFNLTEQGKIIKENPTLAKQYATAAGVTLTI